MLEDSRKPAQVLTKFKGINYVYGITIKMCSFVKKTFFYVLCTVETFKSKYDLGYWKF